MDYIKFGIIGTGQAARFHINGAKNHSNVKFVAAYDIVEKSVQKFAKRLKVEGFTDLDKFLNSDIDAVHINVPHYLHKDLVIEAAKAGKHIICEKPMANTLKECDEMINATKKAGVKFMVAENHRFLPAHKYIKGVIEKGLIGDVFLIRSYEGAYDDPTKFCDPNHWMFSFDKGGGGALFDQGVHKFATINWLLNDKVESAQSWCIKTIESPSNKGEDTASVLLHYKKGAIAEVSVSTSAIHTPTNRIEIQGTMGTILEDHDWNPPVKIFSTHKEAPKKGEFYIPEIEHSSFPKYYLISFGYEDAHFADCIINNKDPEFTPEEAREAVAVARLAYLAAKKGSITTMEEFLEMVKNKEIENLFEGFDKVIIKSYEHLKWP
ncbi:MAG: Gfo/Idh/MocA family protein [Candidatus Helarchaeota archaeon]